MAVPPQNMFHRPILEMLVNAERSVHRRDVIRDLEARFEATAEDLEEMVPTGVQTKFENRANWGISYLKLAGMLEYPERGRIQITDAGRRLLANSPEIITTTELRNKQRSRSQQEQAQGRVQGEEVVTIGDVIDGIETSDDSNPDEQMEEMHRAQVLRLKDEILEYVKSIDPTSFERLVTRLLSEMGYGDIEQAQGRPGDRGIDGILSQDKLGLEKVYVQSKRWTGNPIAESEVHKFAGSLDRPGASKGVFITTSEFAPSAQQYVEVLASKTIRLIDGEELASLMIDHNVGVVVAKTYQVKKMDKNFFADA